MNQPFVDEYGKVDSESIERLTTGELRKWIWDRLHGQDSVYVGDFRSADMPHYLIVILYHHVGIKTKETIQLVILEFLRDLVESPNSEWLDESGSELLMLVVPVLEEPATRDVTIQLLLQIADFTRRSWYGSELHFRALQGLLQLGYKADSEFWKRNYRDGGEEYAPITLEGLSGIGLSDVFGWLIEASWNDDLECALSGIFPKLIDCYGANAVSAEVVRVIPGLSVNAIRLMTDMAESEGIEFGSVEDILLMAGRTAREKGDDLAAISLYSKVIELSPSCVQALNNRGVAYSETNNYYKAISDFNSVIGLDQGFAAAYINRGIVYIHTRQYKKAIKSFDLAINLEPNYIHAYNARGAAHAMLEEFADAIRDYDMAISLDPKFAQAYFNRAVARYAMLGENELTARDYTRAIELDSSFSEPILNRSFSYAQS